MEEQVPRCGYYFEHVTAPPHSLRPLPHGESSLHDRFILLTAAGLVGNIRDCTTGLDRVEGCTVVERAGGTYRRSLEAVVGMCFNPPILLARLRFSRGLFLQILFVSPPTKVKLD